jgi:allantoate deiminase
VHEGHVAHSAEWLQAQIRAAISAEAIPVRDLPSGAGHDGMAIIDLPTDICVLFVRCKGGIGHNPLESITGRGCRCLGTRVPVIHRELPACEDLT